MEFAHLTFQEYLTAAHMLAKKGDGNDWTTMASDVWYHEMLRLFAAQGDATPVAEACLSLGTVDALSLAGDFLEEAREINIDCRQAIQRSLIEGLESSEPARRRMAAEVILARRLQSLQPIDEHRAIDSSYLTCSEYQLFLDDMREQRKDLQPDHWTAFKFPAGAGRDPITGARPEDAKAFCGWLSRRRGGSVIYRLPTEEEARSQRGDTDLLGAWWRRKRGIHSGSPIKPRDGRQERSMGWPDH